MNLQLRSFLECADNDEHTFSKCEVSHIVEVTTRAIHHDILTAPRRTEAQLQWNMPSGVARSRPPVGHTPPREEGEGAKMTVGEDEFWDGDNHHSTYQSMSTRYFITHNSSNAWQTPPHSRQYRDTHSDANQGKSSVEKYMEIPPFRTMPYTSESAAASSSGGTGGGSRPWNPSCSILIWCNEHNNFYEVHVLS